MITDYREFHEDGSATTELQMLDLETDKVESVCKIPSFNYDHLEGALRALRVDGHPCWSRDYKKVSLQGTHNGARQLYVVNMQEWIS